MSKKIIPLNMFDICLIDNKTKQEIRKLYPKREHGAYYINKFEKYVTEYYQLTLKEYCKKYLKVEWPKCPVKNIDVGWRPSGKGIILQLCARGGMSREHFPKFNEFCERMKTERKGEGNPMFGKVPWNIKEKCKQEYLDKLSSLAVERMLGKTKWGPTKIEIKMGEALKELGIDFIEQYQIDFYCVDFAIPALKLVIECDGDYWHCNPKFYPNGPINKTQKRRIHKDASEKTFLENKGWKVLRFWECDINAETFKPKLEKNINASLKNC